MMMDPHTHVKSILYMVTDTSVLKPTNGYVLFQIWEGGGFQVLFKRGHQYHLMSLQYLYKGLTHMYLMLWCFPFVR